MNSIYKFLHKLFKRENNWYNEQYVQFRDQEANDYVRKCIANALNTHSGFMISKWGTIELGTTCCLLSRELKIPVKAKILGEIGYDKHSAIDWLCKNAGFFPNDIKSGKRFAHMALDDASQIDILGSYIDKEKYIQGYLKNSVKVNLDGYYAPFLWQNPWTMELKGRRVLVVHPFADTIERQYKNRSRLFQDQNVLPEFESLTIIKAVQSIAGNGVATGYKNWFEALNAMKRQMDKIDYDVALIGCGAYGMSSAAHAKRQGKVAVHLAGWTQMLFGIYGNRWLNDQPQYAKYINEYWVRPSCSEKPQGAEKVENACYW